MAEKLLQVKHLEVNFATRQGVISPVRGVSFEVHAHETLGIIGESGCGKSVTAQALMGLLSPRTTRVEGEVVLAGEALHSLSARVRRQRSGRDMAMIFQDPLASLNPVMTIGEQIAESLRLHTTLSRRQRQEKILSLLEQVGIPDPARCAVAWPHELSGGMRQRVMIAMAIATSPALLIADEPTTALDVTVQAQIMTLLNELKREFNTAIIMITHDLGVVAGICDQVMVMYAGRTMEYGTAEQIFYHPTHPYSIGLMDAIPRLDGNEEHLVTIPGNPPNLLHLPKGCPFSPRCQFATEQCQTAPKLTAFNEGQLRNCWLPVEKFTL